MSDSNPGSTGIVKSGRYRRGLVPALVLLASAVVTSTVASVNTFPVLTNDSLAYLGHSLDFSSFGLVNVGYRQLGYPVVLAVLRFIAETLTIEPLLFVSLVQGALLLLAAGLTIALWKWAAVPFLLFVLAASTVAYPNFVLTEGFSISLAVLLAISLAHFIMHVGEWAETHRARLWWLGAAVALIATFLLTIRYPFAVFGVAPVAMVWSSWRTNFRQPALLLLAGYIAVAGLISFGLSAENQNEYGVFFPTVRSERSAYWATWSVVFTLNPENAEDPNLQTFYDDGNPYQFIADVDSSGRPYSEQRAVYQRAIDELLEEADMSPVGSQFESIGSALRGGRLDDLDGLIDRVLASSRFNVDEVIHSNQFSRQEGIEAFSERFNSGEIPEAVLTSEAGLRLPLPDGQTTVSYLLPLALLLMALGLGKPQTRIISAAGLAVVLVYAAAIGAVRADNYRFLITTSAFGLVIATGAGSQMLGLWRAGQLFSRSGDSTRNARVSEGDSGSTDM